MNAGYYNKLVIEGSTEEYEDRFAFLKNDLPINLLRASKTYTF